VTRKRWQIGLACLLVVVISAGAGAHFWWVQRPTAPLSATLPSSARILLQPFHKDSLDLRVGANEELNYEVGMQEGATLVYAWSTGSSGGSGGATLLCEFGGRQVRASEVHNAFVAQSAGWYRWRWKNPNSRSVTIHFKMNGYYDPPAMPPISMPYDR
jgi:hypothetical protein